MSGGGDDPPLARIAFWFNGSKESGPASHERRLHVRSDVDSGVSCHVEDPGMWEWLDGGPMVEPFDGPMS